MARPDNLTNYYLSLQPETKHKDKDLALVVDLLNKKHTRYFEITRSMYQEWKWFLYSTLFAIIAGHITAAFTIPAVVVSLGTLGISVGSCLLIWAIGFAIGWGLENDNNIFPSLYQIKYRPGVSLNIWTKDIGDGRDVTVQSLQDLPEQFVQVMEILDTNRMVRKFETDRILTSIGVAQPLPTPKERELLQGSISLPQTTSLAEVIPNKNPFQVIDQQLDKISLSPDLLDDDGEWAFEPSSIEYQLKKEAYEKAMKEVEEACVVKAIAKAPPYIF